MIDTDKYEGHTPADDWEKHLVDALCETEFPMTYQDNQLIADAPKLLAEVKRLRMIVAKLEDARIESASMFDRPALFDAVREIYEQRLQDIHQEKREEE